MDKRWVPHLDAAPALSPLILGHGKEQPVRVLLKLLPEEGRTTAPAPLVDLPVAVVIHVIGAALQLAVVGVVAILPGAVVRTAAQKKASGAGRKVRCCPAAPSS